jgi:hypothetical protein
MKLELQLDGERYAPGDSVTGNVLVVEGGDSRKLEVSLNFRERTSEDDEHTPVTLSGGELHAGDLTTGASYPFAIQLPPDALPNFKSKHGELFWEVDARSDERGRDTHERKRIEVAVVPPG